MIRKIRKSLTIKMFLAISLSFILIFAVVLVVQSQFFAVYYESNKIANLLEQVDSFSAEIEAQDLDEDALFREVKNFGSQNNVNVELYNEAIANEKAKRRILLTVLDENDHYWDFYFDSERFGYIATSEYLLLQGYIKDDETLLVTNINDLVVDEYINTDNTMKPYEGVVRIVDKSSADDIIKDRGKFRVLKGEQFHSDQYNMDYTISQMPYSDTKIVTLSKSVNVLGHDTMLYATASLQPVDEAVGMLVRYIPLFLAIAILLSIIIALLYSRTVSRPIVRITKTANAMANMDFSVKVNSDRHDELGVLARSINTLSGNLEKSLGELVTAHAQLQEDYENEMKQEKARREFIANASHELKTPLGVVISYVEAIRDNIKKEKSDYYFDVILDETAKMDGLIMQMLLLAKLDADNVKLRIQHTKMGKLVGETAKRFEGLLKDKNLRIKVCGDFASANVDEPKIKQVLYNLIENAVKYSNPDSQISIAGIVKEDAIRIEVSNDCQPIKEDDLSKVWDRFYKVDTSHNRETLGSGLGLSIVKMILEMHNFDYGVYSTKSGIVFWFEYKSI